MFKKLISFLVYCSNLSIAKVGVLYFAYTLTVSLCLQLVVIPLVFDGSYSDQGLVVPDSCGFHDHALGISESMKTQGWAAWELKPHGGVPTGITALLYYLVTPKPWVILPLNALLHALSALMVYGIIFSVFQKRSPAFWGGAFFLMNPTALEWVAQIHRDGIFIFSNLALIYAWVLLYEFVQHGKKKNIWLSLILFLISGLGIWSAREYWNQVAFVMSLLTVAFFVGLIFKQYGISFVLNSRVWIALLIGFSGLLNYKLYKTDAPPEGRQVADIQNSIMAQLASSVQSPVPEFSELNDPKEPRTEDKYSEQLQGKTLVQQFESIGNKSKHLYQVLSATASQVLDNNISTGSVDLEFENNKQIINLLITELRKELDLLTASIRHFKEASEKDLEYLKAQKRETELIYEQLHKNLALQKQYLEHEKQGFQYQKIEFARQKAEFIKAQEWIDSRILPKSVERKLMGLSFRRESTKNGGGFGGARTDVDQDIRFNSVYAMIFYLPRALQLGLLSPMPDMWKSDGRSAYTDVARKVIGVLTVFNYCLLAGFVILLILKCRNPVLMLVLPATFTGLLVFTYVYPNIGTLMRFRYGFYSLILALGVAAIVVGVEFIYKKIIKVT